MKFLALLLLPLISYAQTDTEFINKTLYPATALLYSQDKSGDMHMRCTATAIGHKDNKYTFVSASHCVSTDEEEDKIAEVENTFFFISPDNQDKKEFFRAKVIAAGYQHKGDDFSILEIETSYKFTTVSLGEDSKNFGDPIVNVASPVGLGKQVLFGNISNPKMDRPLVQDDINWSGAIILQLPNNTGGSSGSSIVCLNQHAICGFIVGTVAKEETIAIPVSRFKEFQAKIAAGTYKYFKHLDE